MPKVIDYALCYAEKPSDVLALVQKAMLADSRWEPQGGISFGQMEGRNVWIQAMVLVEYTNED